MSLKYCDFLDIDCFWVHRARAGFEITNLRTFYSKMAENLIRIQLTRSLSLRKCDVLQKDFSSR